MGAAGEALYFSRAPIPFARDLGGKVDAAWIRTHRVYRHLGLYAYRADFLQEFSRLPAGRYSELAEDCGDVMVHGADGHDEAIGDLAVRQSRGQQIEHLRLAGREPEAVVSGRCCRSAGDVPHAKVAQLPARHPRCGLRAERLEQAKRLKAGPGVAGAQELLVQEGQNRFSVDGRVITAGFTAARNWTTAPTAS